MRTMLFATVIWLGLTGLSYADGASGADFSAAAQTHTTPPNRTPTAASTNISPTQGSPAAIARGRHDRPPTGSTGNGDIVGSSGSTSTPH